MRYEKSIDSIKNLIETFIELNDKLYKQTINQKHIEQNIDRTENYVNNRMSKKFVRTKFSRNIKHQNNIVFIKFNTMVSRNFKNKKKPEKKIQRVTHVMKKVTMSKITNRITLFDNNSMLH